MKSLLAEINTDKQILPQPVERSWPAYLRRMLNARRAIMVLFFFVVSQPSFSGTGGSHFSTSIDRSPPTANLSVQYLPNRKRSANT
jgi:hypothetical protein